MDYEHHYLVTNICTTMSSTVVVTIVQYTSSELIFTGNDTGVGKVVIETYEIGENIRDIKSHMLNLISALIYWWQVCSFVY
jgi:hypothetical protein